MDGASGAGFLMIAAIGKFGLFCLMLIFWLQGDFPIAAPLVATGDLISALIFSWWLWKTRGSNTS